MRYFDLHCDTMTECALKNCELLHNDLFVSMEKASDFQPWFQIFAVWIPDGIRGDDAKNRFQLVYQKLRLQLLTLGSSLSYCGNAADMEKAFQNKKNACLLSIEGSAALAGKIELLPEYYELGVRIITLTWNGVCEAGNGCMMENARGLTPFGLELLQKMGELKMIVDVSHLSEPGFNDVVRNFSGPFVATHSNSRAVCNHPRNLTDEQFLEIVSRKGLVGLNLCPAFLRKGGKARISDVLKHVEHFLMLGGEDVLAIGADFDGAPMPRGIHSIQDIKKLYKILLKHYPENLVDKIFFDNAYKFFKTSLTDCKSCNNIIK